MSTIACVGECMLELSGVDRTPQIGFGGDTLNSAVYLSRVLGKKQVDYVTRLGDDPFSARLESFMRGEGVGTSHIARIKGALPAFYAITLDKGERKFHYWRGQSPVRNLLKQADAKVEAFLRAAGCVLASGITLAVISPAGRRRLLGCTRGKKGKFAYLVNDRPVLWDSSNAARKEHERALALADFAFVSDDELANLWPGRNGAGKLSSLCRGELVKTAGGDGCEIWRLGKLCAKVASSRAKPVDTTAAGDSFAARYLAGRLNGEDQVVAAKKACQLATCVIMHHGAIIARSMMPRGCSVKRS